MNGISWIICSAPENENRVKFTSKKEKKSEVKDIRKINEETSKIDNEEILSNENLKTNVFDRNQRVLNSNLKGVWVATVARLDFPHTSSAESQKKEIDTIMDNVKSWGLNAVFFHVRPTADAFYLSENEPWSIYSYYCYPRTHFSPIKRLRIL